MKTKITKYLVIGMVLLLACSIFLTACGDRRSAPAGGGAAVAAADPSQPPAGYPRRAITAICPWGAGGATDIAFRQYMAALSRVINQDINVINVTGGNGSIGHAQALAAPADGYTICLLIYDILSNEISGVVRDSYKDFAMLSMFTRQGLHMFVRRDSGWNTFDDFVRAARAAGARGQTLQITVSGNFRYAAGLMVNAAGIADFVTIIPQPGTAEMLTEMLGRHAHAMVSTFAIALPQLGDGGALMSLGTMLEERHPDTPDIPTFVEMGYPTVVSSSFRIAALHKDTPPAIVNYMRWAAGEAFKDAEFQRWAETARADPFFMDHKELDTFMAQTWLEVRDVMRSLGLAQM